MPLEFASAPDRARRRLTALAARCFAVASLIAVVATAGCAQSATSPSGFAAYSQTDLVVGAGDPVAANQSVTVNYTGWLYDGTKPNNRGAQFDSSIGQTPYTFTLGANAVIAGWEKGVPGMSVGGVRVLVVPPSLGYGDTRHGPIPPNATLVFEIDLLSVQ